MWPNPRELMQYGNKVNLIINLETVARLAGIPRPRTVVIDKPEVGRLPKDIVLKRGSSKSSCHVILPKESDSTRRRRLEEDSNMPDLIWFYQPYIPQMVELGELRVLCVKQDIVYVVLTRPNEDHHLNTCFVETITPLDQLG
jgi:glutathione synthase/RimK-type ligase-like ATP-grasp enzyme